MDNLYGGKKFKLKSLKNLKSKKFKQESSSFLFFVKPKWIIIVFGILLTVYNYSIIANRTVDYYNSGDISKFKAGQLGFLISISIMIVLSFIVQFIPRIFKIATIIIYATIIGLWISVFIALIVLIDKTYKDKNTDYDLEKRCKNNVK